MRKQTLVWIGVAVSGGIGSVLIPPARTFLIEAVQLLAIADLQQLKIYLFSFGIWAPLISAALMVVQSIAAPLPAFIVTAANGLLFGPFWGGLLSWSSAMVAAALCFFIGKGLGRPVVECLVGKGNLFKTDQFFQRYGKHTVLITRLIPLISFDVISYASGLTVMRFLDFWIATGIGMIPATTVYSILGYNFQRSWKVALWSSLGFLGLLLFSFVLKQHIQKKL